jgi:16S rRNA (guanine527-N7)-methyltransferase
MIYEELVLRGALKHYIDLLLEWNKKMNLVSVKSREELIERHILDSLQLMEYLGKEEIVYDIGSGAGFPGMVLSYAGMKNMNLVEVNQKKASFLKVASCISPNPVTIHNISSEMLKNVVCDVIVSRAVASVSDIFNLSKGIYRAKTRYLLQKGKNVKNEIESALKLWNFDYTIYNSKTSLDGCILLVENLKGNGR